MQGRSPIGKLRAQALVVGYIERHPGATGQDIEADLGSIIFDIFRNDIPIDQVEYRGGGWYPKKPIQPGDGLARIPELIERIGPERARQLLVDALRTTRVLADEVVHMAPSGDKALTPCCGRTIFELHTADRLTLDPTLVTCQTDAPTKQVDYTVTIHLDSDDLKKIARAKRRVELDAAAPTQPHLVASVALDQRDVELFIKEAVRVALERLS